MSLQNTSASKNLGRSLNLELFDPKQFDISFTSSANTESTLMDQSFRSNETDKDLINELDVMASYINGIDNHLKYRDMILKTTAVSIDKMKRGENTFLQRICSIFEFLEI